MGIAVDNRDEVVDAALFEVLAGNADPSRVNVVGVEVAAGLAASHGNSTPVQGLCAQTLFSATVTTNVRTTKPVSSQGP